MKADVCLDARMFRHSGIGTYINGLLSGFGTHLFFTKHSLGLALPPGIVSNPLPPIQPVNFSAPIYSFQEQWEYPGLLRKARVWHSPHYNIPLWKGKTRLVVTVHDLIHWIFRGRFFSAAQAQYSSFFFNRAARIADRVICVSQKTREDLIRYFKVPENKIRVIYEGVAPEFFTLPERKRREEVLVRYGLPEHFFLYVGLLKPHKNVKRLVDVYRKLRREGKIDSSLVIVGKKDKKYPAGYEPLKDLKTGDGICYLPGVQSREELACLYASARALVHPSLYEGFGLTCLEAMASGLPVIVSDRASLPEVAGEAGEYIDPESEASIEEALIRINSSAALRKNLAEKGRAQAKKFNWQKTAAETLDIYQELLA